MLTLADLCQVDYLVYTFQRKVRFDSLVVFGLGHTTQFLGPTVLICKFVETVVFLAVLFSRIVYAKQGH